ncbi:TRAP transporter small permease [Paracoccus lutimaris]|uniref:TRAP transporter small permease protein n=1 Tax=Paracoccus lutimaris TaxID=1490030 RepID=A0A368Z3K0_9RHOB|nr:TRAP transporter small permease [Paracoccus lutimaris]RCW87030.1 TRAP-type C4-dicarboxylate transport system permease small subunit [Paracoccus lutimaris]
MRALRNWEDHVAAAALAVVFVAVSWGVMARYVSPRPAVWSGELATLGFAWIVFVGAAAGARQHLHIGVDLVTARLPQAAQRWIAIGVSLFLAVALAYIAWLAVQIGIKSYNRPTPVMRLPSSIVHVAVFVGFTSIAVGCLRDAIRMLKGQP